MYGDAIEMITGIDAKHLKEFKEMAEKQVEYYTRALQLRKKVMEEIESTNDMYMNIPFEPEKYFIFRVKDKACMIVKTNRTTTDGKTIHEKKTFYAIACYGFRPKRVNAEYNAYKQVYGMWEKIEPCITEWLYYCANMLEQCGWNLYDDINLFC